jgi:hypothetical protein
MLGVIVVYNCIGTYEFVGTTNRQMQLKKIILNLKIFKNKIIKNNLNY